MYCGEMREDDPADESRYDWKAMGARNWRLRNRCRWSKARERELEEHWTFDPCLQL